MKHFIQCTALYITLLVSISSCGDDAFGPKIKGSGVIATEDRSLASFNSIEVKGSANVVLTQDTNQQVHVEADDNIMAIIATSVRNNKLYIDIKGSYTSAHDVKVYVTIEGSGDVYGETMIVGNDLDMNISGSGNVDLELDYTYLSSKISGSVRFDLYGTVDTQEISISGSGDYNAKDLLSKTCKIEISGSGNGEVSVSEQLDANIRGSGDITYYGNPQVNSSVKGSGSLSKG